MKLAVIVPVYKVEPYLRQCVDSILSQSYQDLKVILVDDGSPDSCGAICDEYAEQDSRVLTLHKANGGQSSARNLALQHIDDCPFVTFLDSDDWLVPEIYQQGVNYLVDHPEVSMVNYGYNLVTEEKTIPLIPEEERMTREEALLHYVATTSNIINTMVWSRIYRCEVLQGLTFTEGCKWEDVVYAFEALYHSTGAYHILPLAGVNYRSKRPGAMTSEILPDKRALFLDIEMAIRRHPDDASFLALANTLATNCLWYYLKYLATFSYPVATSEMKLYLPIIKELRSRPYLDAFHSASKVRKVRLFLSYPRAFFAVRTFVRSLLSRK